MNKLNVFLFVALIGLTKTVYARPQIKDSIEAYNYWAYRGIIEMVYAYMNDYVETVGESKASAEIIGKNLFEKDFITDIDNKTLPSPEDISIFQKKNHWNGAEKKLFQPLKNNFDNSVQLNIKFFAAKKPGSDDFITDIPGHINKKTNWNKQKEIIISNYLSALEKLAEKYKSQTIVIYPIVEEKKDVTETVNGHSKKSNVDWVKWAKYFSIFLIGLILGGSLIFFISKWKIYSILDFEKDKYLHELKLSGKTFIFNYIGLFDILKKRKEEYKNKIDSKYGNMSNVLLKEKIETLKKENLNLKQKNDALTTNTSYSEDNKSNTQEWNVEKPPKMKQKLFFNMPEADGRFMIDNGESSNDGRKYFRIEYIEDSENGELFFIPSERDKRAINRVEAYLKPVCEIENIANAEEATQVDFISPGKVVLIGDCWVIDSNEKVKIKLV